MSQLAWLGIDAPTLDVLRPYVVVLPEKTPLNVNTASRETLSAEIANLDLGSAERLIQLRQRAPFKSIADFYAALGQPQGQAPPNIDVKSSYFEVRGRLRLADRVLEERSLVHRRQTGQSDVIDRERIASRDERPTS